MSDSPRVLRILERIVAGDSWNQLLLDNPDVDPSAVQAAVARGAAEALKSRGSPPDSAYFAAILGHYIHQNDLMWSRTHIAFALEAASLGGAYAARADTLIALAVLTLGTTLLILLERLMRKDRTVRNANRRLIVEYSREVASAAQSTPFLLADDEKGNTVLNAIFWLVKGFNAIAIGALAGLLLR